MEAFHELKVNCPYEILEIKDIRISNKPNEHGSLYLKALVDEDVNFKYAIEASTEDKICIYEQNEKNEQIVIFNGTIQNIRISNVDRLYYMEIEALTSSFSLDIEERSRSFQDTQMSYDELINTILRDYKIYSFTQCMDMPRSIEKPLFQYKETDYEFLKRIASYLGLQLICDTINTNNVFYFGKPSGQFYEIEDDIDYTSSIDITKYRKSLASSSDIHPTDFFYYIIKSKKVMHIGSKVNFKGKELYVNSYEAEYIRGDLAFTYKLCRKKGIWQEKLYNEKLKGISLEGQVLEVSGEQVKLHLNIDEAQNQDKAAWFRYAPPTGNIMYSMPIVGTNANLYFPSERSSDPLVIGCVRKNGSSSEKFSNVNNRYFATESGNNLDMLPGAINFSRPGLSATFNDGGGINFSSSSSLSLSAGYLGLFAGNVTIKGRSKVVAKKGGSIISLENDFYNNAGIVMENGSDRASNEKFTDDDPQNGVAEAKAAMMEAIEAAIGAISAAIQGAIGKIGSCLPIGTEAQIETQTTNSIYPNNSSKDNEITSLGDMFNRTGEAFKEIGSDIYNGLNERRQKALDSPYDFVNYLTLGLPDIGKGILEQNQRNEEKFLKTGSSYDIGNWITFGSFDMIKGTFNPEKPFSKEHWMNSFATALMVSGGAKGIQVTPDKSFKTGPKVNSKIPSNTEQLNSTFDKSYGGFCFTSDTLIYTKDGYKYIKDLQIGDQVYSINKYTKEKGIKKVTNVFIKKVDSIIHIIIKGAVIKTTLKHQFWVVGKGWIKACELKAGYNLELYSGKTCEIMSLNIQIMNKLINVYNFEVEEWHTYYVSNQNILVHNICSEYVPRNPKWKAAGTDMWTWAKENGYELSFGGGSDIGKMFVKNKNGELIGEIHSGQIVDKGFNAGKEFQIHFEYYFDGTMKTDPSLHLYFED